MIPRTAVSRHCYNVAAVSFSEKSGKTVFARYLPAGAGDSGLSKEEG
ncbi:hypothetical protein [Petralouisia muris]|jgi:hypothetical protein|nr:hypothetical protein [Petralouisia muris]